jgi:hypothetical protein
MDSALQALMLGCWYSIDEVPLGKSCGATGQGLKLITIFSLVAQSNQIKSPRLKFFIAATVQSSQ